MKFLCLMPTYGRPRMVENAIAMFEAQDYATEDRKLFILDDAGQLPAGGRNGWSVISTAERFPSLMAKYQAMMAAEGWPDHFAWDAVALMDDDDIYGPQWLSSHAAALGDGRFWNPPAPAPHWMNAAGWIRNRWSHPRQVWSLHRPPAKSPTEPGLEPSGGRFWASAAVRADLLQETGGFHDITRATFDQEHMALWKSAGGEPGRPDDFATPQYVYGWGRSNHVSGKMGSADWYERHSLQAKVSSIDLICPQFDAQSREIFGRLRCHNVAGTTVCREGQ